MNRNFVQTLRVHCPDPTKLIELIEQWDLANATSEDLTAYMGTRVLADRQHLGYYTLIIDFGVIDPDVPAADEAARHNERPETKAMAAAAALLIEGEPVYEHFDEIYRTDR
jgi:hypothetical protein